MPLSFKLFRPHPRASASVEKLIVGLGNPGRSYARNRHNTGFQVVDRLAMAHSLAFDQQKSRGLLALGRIADHYVAILKPQTYMNLSGQAVTEVARFYKVPIQDILVIYDDLDLPLGQLRLRPSGGTGGHNGVASIIAALGSQDFPHLRVGIGRPSHGDPVDYVLSDFTADELPFIEAAFGDAVAAIELYLREGLEAAMNRYNQGRLIDLRP
jgi:PTH1 family peptidyl-tRNA hydrolase